MPLFPERRDSTVWWHQDWSTWLTIWKILMNFFFIFVWSYSFVWINQLVVNIVLCVVVSKTFGSYPACVIIGFYNELYRAISHFHLMHRQFQSATCTGWRYGFRPYLVGCWPKQPEKMACKEDYELRGLENPVIKL